MKSVLLGLCLFVFGIPAINAQTVADCQEEEILTLSKNKWQWMADKYVDKLNMLFHEKSKFVHMSGTWGKSEELEVIKTGRIWYKEANVSQTVLEVYDDTAILWSRITLLANVRGNEVTTPFTVTEVFEKSTKGWKLLALTFSSVRPEHIIEKK